MTKWASWIKPIREWGTPMTIGSFIIMAVTGGLMFFHKAMALNGMLHRWSGLFMIGAVALHSAANWSSIDRYIKRSNIARAVIGVCVVVLVGSFFNLWGYPGKSEGIVYNAVMTTPITNVATITNQPLDQVKSKLSQAGIVITSPTETLEQATKGDLNLQDKAVDALFVSKS